MAASHSGMSTVSDANVGVIDSNLSRKFMVLCVLLGTLDLYDDSGLQPLFDLAFRDTAGNEVAGFVRDPVCLAANQMPVGSHD